MSTLLGKRHWLITLALVLFPDPHLEQLCLRVIYSVSTRLYLFLAFGFSLPSVPLREREKIRVYGGAPRIR